MQYIMAPATADHIVGQLVGSGQQHIAIAVEGRALLAVRLDGKEYVTWYWYLNPGDQTVHVGNGEYFLTSINGKDRPAMFKAAVSYFGRMSK